MHIFVPASFILLLMTCWTRGDDEGLSLWGWPYESFGGHVTGDDSRETDSSNYFSRNYNSHPTNLNHFSNPYSGGNLNRHYTHHHNLPEHHQQSNPYGQIQPHYYNPLALFGFSDKDSDEKTFDNMWSTFVRSQNLPHQMLRPSSRDTDEGKFIWNFPSEKSHTDSSDETRGVNSVLQIGDEIIGAADSSEEDLWGNQNGAREGESNIGYGGDRSRGGTSGGGTSGGGDSKGGGQGGYIDWYNLWPFYFSATSPPIVTRFPAAASTTRRNVTPSPNTETTQKSTERKTTPRKTTKITITERTTTRERPTTTERVTTPRKITTTERVSTPRKTTTTSRPTIPKKTTTIARTTTPRKTTTTARPTTPRKASTTTRPTTLRKTNPTTRPTTPRKTTTTARTTTRRTTTITTRTTTPRRTPMSTITTSTIPTTTTTTTRKPTTTLRTTTTPTPSTTSSPVVPEICAGSDVIDKVGYKAHWSDCSKFIQCTFRPDGSTTVYIKTCASGTLWDQRSLSCSQANLVNCPHDRCKTSGLDRYPSATSCRSYFICREGKSESVCCPPNHSYDHVRGCVPNATCFEECKDRKIVQDVCDKRAVLNKPLLFEQYNEGQGWTLKICAPDTAFNEMICQCSDQNSGQSPEIDCSPELYIPFTGDIKDESGNNNYLQVEGVKVVHDTGYFDGQSVIRVPRFSNLDFGDTVIIKLRYKSDGGRAGSNVIPQALVANGDCNNPSSLYLVTDQGGLTVGLQTQEGGRTNISVPSSGSGWKEAVLMVDRSVLQGALNGVSYQTLFTGSIDPSKCALQIGRGTEFAHFHGYMDDITVYLCKPKGF